MRAAIAGCLLAACARAPMSATPARPPESRAHSSPAVLATTRAAPLEASPKPEAEPENKAEPAIDWTYVLVEPRLFGTKPFPNYVRVHNPRSQREVDAFARGFGTPRPAADCTPSASYEQARQRGLTQVQPQQYARGTFTSRTEEELLIAKVSWCNHRGDRIQQERLVLSRPANGTLVLDMELPKDLHFVGLIDLDDDGVLEVMVNRWVRYELLHFTPTGIEAMWSGSFATKHEPCPDFGCDCGENVNQEEVRVVFHQTALRFAEMVEEIWVGPCGSFSGLTAELLKSQTTRIELSESAGSAAR